MVQGELGKAESDSVCLVLPLPASQDAFLHRVTVETGHSGNSFFFFPFFPSFVINRFSIN